MVKLNFGGFQLTPEMLAQIGMANPAPAPLPTPVAPPPAALPSIPDLSQIDLSNIQLPAELNIPMPSELPLPPPPPPMEVAPGPMPEPVMPPPLPPRPINELEPNFEIAPGALPELVTPPPTPPVKVPPPVLQPEPVAPPPPPIPVEPPPQPVPAPPPPPVPAPPPPPVPQPEPVAPPRRPIPNPEPEPTPLPEPEPTPLPVPAPPPPPPPTPAPPPPMPVEPPPMPVEPPPDSLEFIPVPTTPPPPPPPEAVAPPPPPMRVDPPPALAQPTPELMGRIAAEAGRLFEEEPGIRLDPTPVSPPPAPVVTDPAPAPATTGIDALIGNPILDITPEQIEEAKAMMAENGISTAGLDQAAAAITPRVEPTTTVQPTTTVEPASTTPSLAEIREAAGQFDLYGGEGFDPETFAQIQQATGIETIDNPMVNDYVAPTTVTEAVSNPTTNPVAVALEDSITLPDGSVIDLSGIETGQFLSGEGIEINPNVFGGTAENVNVTVNQDAPISTADVMAGVPSNVINTAPAGDYFTDGQLAEMGDVEPGSTYVEGVDPEVYGNMTPEQQAALDDWLANNPPGTVIATPFGGVTIPGTTSTYTPRTVTPVADVGDLVIRGARGPSTSASSYSQMGTGYTPPQSLGNPFKRPESQQGIGSLAGGG